MPNPTWNGATVTPGHLHRAATVCRETLAPALDADWSVPAGPLTWTCRETLDHISDALGFYCGQLRYPRRRSTTPFPQRRSRLDDPAPLRRDRLRRGHAWGDCTASPPDIRAFHRMGIADPEGFLAMGCEEILVHTWDISQGLELHMQPPDEIAQAVLHRLFPWAPTGCSAWQAQLWCSTGSLCPARAKSANGAGTPPQSPNGTASSARSESSRPNRFSVFGFRGERSAGPPWPASGLPVRWMALDGAGGGSSTTVSDNGFGPSTGAVATA